MPLYRSLFLMFPYLRFLEQVRHIHIAHDNLRHWIWLTTISGFLP